MAVQHLPRDLLRSSSGLKDLLQMTKKKPTVRWTHYYGLVHWLHMVVVAVGPMLLL